MATLYLTIPKPKRSLQTFLIIVLVELYGDATL